MDYDVECGASSFIPDDIEPLAWTPEYKHFGAYRRLGRLGFNTACANGTLDDGRIWHSFNFRVQLCHFAVIFAIWRYSDRTIQFRLRFEGEGFAELLKIQNF